MLTNKQMYDIGIAAGAVSSAFFLFALLNTFLPGYSILSPVVSILSSYGVYILGKVEDNKFLMGGAILNILLTIFPFVPFTEIINDPVIIGGVIIIGLAEGYGILQLSKFKDIAKPIGILFILLALLNVIEIFSTITQLISFWASFLVGLGFLYLRYIYRPYIR